MTEQEARAEAEAWLKRLDGDSHWARSPEQRERIDHERTILSSLLAASGRNPKCEHGIALSDLCSYAETIANEPVQVEDAEAGSEWDESEWDAAVTRFFGQDVPHTILTEAVVNARGGSHAEFFAALSRLVLSIQAAPRKVEVTDDMAMRGAHVYENTPGSPVDAMRAALVVVLGSTS